MSPPLQGALALRSRLEAIVSALDGAEALLGVNAFREPTPAWLETAPALAAHLLGLDDAEVDALELAPAALTARLERIDARYGACAVLGDTGRWPERAALPQAQPPHVPGRKWAQIRAFAGVLGTEPGPRVDWCAGKGHLGRQLHLRDGGAVRCIERDPALCADGEVLARDLPLRFECRDVIAEPPTLRTEEHVAALHACGHLHDALLTRTAEDRPRGIALAPCCYHLGASRDAPWRPRSATAPQDVLPDELVRLAVRETVTAPAHVRRRRRRERAWRLGFEALRRSLEPEQAGYRAFPSVPGRLLSAGFDAFCAHGAAHLGIVLPAHIDSGHWIAVGAAADARVRRLDLARAPFRRLLELRMVLDRALAFTEAGYEVAVGEFCARELTPRNLMLCAERLS